MLITNYFKVTDEEKFIDEMKAYVEGLKNTYDISDEFIMAQKENGAFVIFFENLNWKLFYEKNIFVSDDIAKIVKENLQEKEILIMNLSDMDAYRISKQNLENGIDWVMEGANVSLAYSPLFEETLHAGTSHDVTLKVQQECRLPLWYPNYGDHIEHKGTCKRII